MRNFHLKDKSMYFTTLFNERISATRTEIATND